MNRIIIENTNLDIWYAAREWLTTNVSPMNDNVQAYAYFDDDNEKLKFHSLYYDIMLKHILQIPQDFDDVTVDHITCVTGNNEEWRMLWLQGYGGKSKSRERLIIIEVKDVSNGVALKLAL
jgi:hypothetical protein